MEMKCDLRITRTYKSLTEAFLQLMSEKHFEDITINELCEQAMIRRTTFYKHFADKYEFFRFFIQKMQADFDESNASSADYQNLQSFLISILRHAMAFLEEHDRFINNILSSNLVPTLLDIFSEQINLDITEKLKIAIKKGIEVPASPEVVASFFTGAIIHTMRWWLLQKKKMSEEKLIEEVDKILNFIARS